MWASTVERAVERRPHRFLTFKLIDAPAPLAGDYNGDGAVDAADYVLWRENPGCARWRPSRLQHLAHELWQNVGRRKRARRNRCS